MQLNAYLGVLFNNNNLVKLDLVMSVITHFLYYPAYHCFKTEQS